MRHETRLLCQRGHDHGGVPLPSGVEGAQLLRGNRRGQLEGGSVELLPPRDVGLVQDLQSTDIQRQAVNHIYLIDRA